MKCLVHKISITIPDKKNALLHKGEFVLCKVAKDTCEEVAEVFNVGAADAHRCQKGSEEKISQL